MEEEILEIDMELYPKDVIFSASYALLDVGYFFLERKTEKDNKTKVVVFIESKDKTKISNNELKKVFLDQLVNYSLYHSQLKEGKDIKEFMLKEIYENSINKTHPKREEIFNFEETIDDPEGILIPWEEKYSKKKQTDKKNEKDEYF